MVFEKERQRRKEDSRAGRRCWRYLESDRRVRPACVGQYRPQGERVRGTEDKDKRRTRAACASVPRTRAVGLQLADDFRMPRARSRHVSKPRQRRPRARPDSAKVARFALAGRGACHGGGAETVSVVWEQREKRWCGDSRLGGRCARFPAEAKSTQGGVECGGRRIACRGAGLDLAQRGGWACF